MPKKYTGVDIFHGIYPPLPSDKNNFVSYLLYTLDGVRSGAEGVIPRWYIEPILFISGERLKNPEVMCCRSSCTAEKTFQKTLDIDEK